MIRCIHSRIILTECASESLYSVQNIANIRIRLIFDSSNTLVYRLGPNIYVHYVDLLFSIYGWVAHVVPTSVLLDVNDPYIDSTLNGVIHKHTIVVNLMLHAQLDFF